MRLVRKLQVNRYIYISVSVTLIPTLLKIFKIQYYILKALNQNITYTYGKN